MMESPVCCLARGSHTPTKCIADRPPSYNWLESSQSGQHNVSHCENSMLGADEVKVVICSDTLLISATHVLTWRAHIPAISTHTHINLGRCHLLVVRDLVAALAMTVQGLCHPVYPAIGSTVDEGPQLPPPEQMPASGIHCKLQTHAFWILPAVAAHVVQLRLSCLVPAYFHEGLGLPCFCRVCASRSHNCTDHSRPRLPSYKDTFPSSGT